MNIPSSYLPQSPQTYHMPPPVAMAPTKKSGNTLKVVLISLAIIMVLCIVSVVGAVYFVGKKASQTITEMKQRGGFPAVSNNPESVPDSELGIPVYPGAKRENTVKGSMGSMTGAVVTFSSKDEVEKVAQFYRDHFKETKEQINEISDSGDADGQGSVVFQGTAKGSSRLVTVSPHDRNANDTEIVIIIGNGVPGMPGLPPLPPPPPPRNGAERKAREMERQALERAEKVLRDLEAGSDAPPPPPPPRR